MPFFVLGGGARALSTIRRLRNRFRATIRGRRRGRYFSRVDDFLSIDFNRLAREVEHLQGRADALFRARAKAHFNRLSETIQADLRSTVPVRTGLMRRSVGGRGREPRIEIYSNATNSRGTEYAQFVSRYYDALNQAASGGSARLATVSIAYQIYFINGDGTIDYHNILSSMREFIAIEIEDYRIVLTLDLPGPL